MSQSKHSRTAILMVAALCVIALSAWSQSVKDLVTRMPAQNPAEQKEICAQIVKLGAGAVKEICAQLVPLGTGDDTKARYALSALANYVSGAEGQAGRKMVAETLLEALAAAGDANVKDYLMFQLRMAGKEEAVAPLAKYLKDEKLCDPAVRALLTIRGEAAAREIASALPSSQGRNRIALIHALGDLRYEAAEPEIAKSLTSNDRETRLAALYALANMGTPSAGIALAQAVQSAAPYEKSQAASFYLLYAGRLAEKGKRDEGEKICRELMKSRTDPKDAAVQCAAFSELVKMLGDRALPEIAAAIDSPNAQLRGRALELAVSIPGVEVTNKLIAMMEQAAGDKRVAMLSLLARRGDKTALPAIVKNLIDKEKSVRLTAIASAAKLDGNQAASSLIASMRADQPDEIQAIQQALMRIPGEAVLGVIAQSLRSVPEAARMALIDVLAERRDKAHVKELMEQASAKEAPIRLAALKALGKTATEQDIPGLIALALAANDKAEVAAAQKAIGAAAAQDADKDKGSAPILDALGKQSGEKRARLLRTLSAVGGAKALAAVVADTSSADAAVKDAAIRTLADWPEIAAAPELIKIGATAADQAHKVLAVRGYIRLVTDSEEPAAKKVAMYKEALTQIKRPEEKRLILSALGEIKMIPSLQLAASYLDDADLKNEASMAVITIALPADKKAGLKGNEVVAALTKAAEITSNQGLKQKAKDYLRTLTGAPASSSSPSSSSVNEGGTNLALNKPVKTNVKSQGNRKPDLIVDGKISNESAWFGANWPCWLQVDLGSAQKVARARVYFFVGENRYYQYKIEVSMDGQTWKTATDASAITTPSNENGFSHSFDSVDARYVRLNVLKNSSNEAVHVREFQVFGPAGSAASATGSESVEVAQAAPAAPVETVPAVTPVGASKIEGPIAAKYEGELNAPPAGFTAQYNGKDLTGWKGLLFGPNDNPAKRQALKPDALEKEQQKADDDMRKHWSITTDGLLLFDGKGHSLATARNDYGDFEMMVDWKIQPRGDSGVYLRGSPQVQIWDPVQHKIGSGGLYNNQKNPKDALKIADKPTGEWNHFQFKMVGERVTVYLNGELVVDDTVIENYWDRSRKIFPREQIELQCHGNPVYFRNVFIREIPRTAEFDAKLKKEFETVIIPTAKPAAPKPAAPKLPTTTSSSTDTPVSSASSVSPSVSVAVELNLAKGRAVKTSVKQQANHAPESAVDGNIGNDTGWWGAAWPCWWQVDLGQAQKIDAVHINFFSDGSRYYSYKVDVSTDEQEWKTVADKSAIATPAMPQGDRLTFPAVEARYVRVNILKNSANEAVHLNEVMVYAAGTAPAPPKTLEEEIASRPPRIKPQPDAEGFIPLFNGKDLDGWVGAVKGYEVKDGAIVCIPSKGGNLYTEDEYSDFDLKFDVQITSGGNNGVGLRAPLQGDAAYGGMEIQVLDDSSPKYKSLNPYQYHGSVYGVLPCKRGFQKPLGEWNQEEIILKGTKIKIILNGETITEGDLKEASTPEPPDHKKHPGLLREKGRIGFLGHGSAEAFRNIRIKELK
ncbi:MAG: DUF1080 domain-containing protein [Candidatus Sumerlaeota bacterium]|nr:DUF1080 domain-containing protein [Candidatus Sumerlaeota bacterium]